MQEIYTVDEENFTYTLVINVISIIFVTQCCLNQSKALIESLLKNIAKSCLLAVYYFKKFTTEINKEN